MEPQEIKELVKAIKDAKTHSEVEDLVENAARDNGVDVDLSIDSYAKVARKLEESGNQELRQVLEVANERWCELTT